MSSKDQGDNLGGCHGVSNSTTGHKRGSKPPGKDQESSKKPEYPEKPYVGEYQRGLLDLEPGRSRFAVPDAQKHEKQSRQKTPSPRRRTEIDQSKDRQTGKGLTDTAEQPEEQETEPGKSVSGPKEDQKELVITKDAKGSTDSGGSSTSKDESSGGQKEDKHQGNT